MAVDWFSGRVDEFDSKETFWYPKKSDPSKAQEKQARYAKKNVIPKRIDLPQKYINSLSIQRGNIISLTLKCKLTPKSLTTNNNDASKVQFTLKSLSKLKIIESVPISK